MTSKHLKKEGKLSFLRSGQYSTNQLLWYISTLNIAQKYTLENTLAIKQHVLYYISGAVT